MFKNIEDKKRKLDSLRPLNTETVKSIREKLLLDELMSRFIDWYNSKKAQEINPIERDARVRGEFVKIYLFIDGNGRTARLLLNLKLMK